MLKISSQVVIACCLLILPKPADAQQQTAPEPAGNTPKVQGFKSPDASPPRGFATAASNRDKNLEKRSADNRQPRERALRYARSLVRSYDANKNGQLERDEWSRIRGNPAKSDANKDGVLTIQEITTRVASRPPASWSGRSPTSPAKPEATKTASKPNRQSPTQPTKDRPKSYRFTPAAERLPDGLPSWFKQRDKDQDGQVAMHEYARKWSDRTVREFDRYDKNGDGLITPTEAKRR